MSVNSVGGGGLAAINAATSWQDTTKPVLGPQAAETSFRWATVTQASPSLQIQLDGDTQPLPLIPENLIETGTPAVGARVWVQLFGRRVIVLGVSANFIVPEPVPGTYVSWTPQFALGPNFGTGAVIEGSYCRIGDMIQWNIRVVWGSSNAIGAEVDLVLPSAILGPAPGQTIGTWSFYDDSSDLVYGGPMTMRDSGSNLVMFAGAWKSSANNPGYRLGSNAGSFTGNPFSTDVGDILSASGTYRAA